MKDRKYRKEKITLGLQQFISKKNAKIFKFLKFGISCLFIIGFILLGFPFYKNFNTKRIKKLDTTIIDKNLFKKKYNIIIYVIDALRPDHLNIYKYPRPTSPFISSHAREGYIFSNAFSISAWSRPSIGTLLTSLYPVFHGASNRSSYLSKNVITLAEVLKNCRYKTAAFIANGNIFDPGLNFDQGFHYFRPITTNSQGPPSAHEVIKAVRSWLHRYAQGETPFFLYIHTVDSHEPYRYLPHHFEEMKNITLFPPRVKEIIISRPHMEDYFNRYDASIRYSDLNFGRFYKELKALNLINKSIIILTADHGEEFIDHGSHGHGGRLFIEHIKVPLIIWLPERINKQKYIKELVSHLDIAPTIVNLIGLQPPSYWQGKSFAELMTKEKPMYQKRELYFMEELDDNKLYAIIYNNFHYILRLKPKFEEFLFDLEKDPFELQDITQENSLILNILKNKLLNFIAETMPGYHLKYFPSEEEVLQLILETKGKFKNVINNQHIKIEISPDKRKISVQLSRKEDCLFFSVDPENSSILIRNLNMKVPFFLGNQNKKIEKKYVLLEEGAKEIITEFGLSQKTFIKPGIYIWKTRSPSKIQLKLDPQTIKNLKSLGYIR